MNTHDGTTTLSTRARDLVAPAVLALSELVAFAIATAVYAHERGYRYSFDDEPPKIVHQ